MTKHELDELIDGYAYPHMPAHVDMCETHISWVYLTGSWAYKIKKPLRTPYLDYSTLEKRHEACEVELQLNRRFAPELYHSVVPIVRNEEGIRVEGEGEVIEYAVKMRQFPAGALFKEMLAAGTLNETHVMAAAHEIASQHRNAPLPEPGNHFGLATDLLKAAHANFGEMESLLSKPSGREVDVQAADLKRLATWTTERFEALQELLERRREQGFVRECHGDLHLGNVIWLESHVRLFDGIEFNVAFRWLDVWNDFSFLLMDLEEHGRFDLAGLLRNAYLEETGDYEGFILEAWFKLYRAMVRAKVALMKALEANVSQSARDEAMKETRSYIDYGLSLLQPQSQGLVMTYGPSGSGKTTITQPLLATGRCIRVRSDVERKRLHGLGALETSRPEQGIYQSAATEATYAALGRAAERILVGGGWAILDATFLNAESRRAMQAIAESNGVPWYVIPCEASPDILQQRVEARLATGSDASEATRSVITEQLARRDPLTEAEQQHVTTIEVFHELFQFAPTQQRHGLR